MERIKNISFYILSGIIIVLLIINFRQQSKLLNSQKDLENKQITQKQLDDSIIRSSSKYVSKDDLDKFAKDNNISLDTIKKDLGSLDAKLKSINVAEVKTIPIYINNQPTTHTDPNPTPPVKADCPECPPDINGYTKSKQYFALNEKFQNQSVPWGEVGFSAWSKTPWELKTYERKYKSVTVTGENEEGQQVTYTKFSIVSDGKEYPITVDKSETQQIVVDPKIYWWNPKLYLGADFGQTFTYNSPYLGPSINFGFITYGKSKTNITASFLQVGIGYNPLLGEPQITLSPFQYNLGKHIPLMSNFYMGPIVTKSLTGYSVGIGVRVSL